jgi:hypothetical protein
MTSVFCEQMNKLTMAVVWCNLIEEPGSKRDRLYTALVSQVDEPEDWMGKAADIYQGLLT